MNGKVFLILLAMLHVSFVCPLSHATDLILNNALAQVCFCPNEGCTAENLLIIKSRELAGIYLGNWTRHRNHSESYRGRY